MIRITTIAAALAASALPVLADGGDEPHSDILLMRDMAGNLVTGAVDFEDNIVMATDMRVFEAEFDPFGTTDEPGFNALAGSNPQLPTGFQTLAADTTVSFDANAFEVNGVTANLFYWDANGAVNFAAATDALTISKAPDNVFSSILDGSSNAVNGFDIDATNGEGFMHKHIDFSVDTSAAEGIYLFSLTVNVGANSTLPLYFVHAWGDIDEEQHEAAAEFVETQIIPAPGAATLALITGLAAARRRRG